MAENKNQTKLCKNGVPFPYRIFGENKIKKAYKDV